MSVRKACIDRALTSYPSLKTIVNELTEEEVMAALEVESATRRRQSIVLRLIARANRINELRYVAQLKQKYHANPGNGASPCNWHAKKQEKPHGKSTQDSVPR